MKMRKKIETVQQQSQEIVNGLKVVFKIFHNIMWFFFNLSALNLTGFKLKWILKSYVKIYNCQMGKRKNKRAVLNAFVGLILEQL